MKFAYADPPYFGCGASHYGHPEWDNLETHREMIARLWNEYPDGWALSLTSSNLKDILPLCPRDVRVSAWVKPFASFKPGVNPAYAWEPVIWRGGHSAKERGRKVPTIRDWHSVNITLKKGLCGAKPESFCRWIMDLLGYQVGDELDDLFPGTGVMGRVLVQASV